MSLKIRARWEEALLLISHLYTRFCFQFPTHPRARSHSIEISGILESLKGCTEDEFASASAKRSDCGSCRNGGDLGEFTRGQMQKPFEDATFALAVGEMSGIVSTDSGLHIILRTA